VVDVEDCAVIAQELIAEGTATAGRVAIRGVSAGGFTAAVSVAAHDRHLYACATLYCPVLDLLALSAEGTHDFESHYLDSLVGPKECASLYRARSPIHQADRIGVPMLLFQGLDDVVCPPSQAEVFTGALSRHGVPYKYRTFEGEGHGFRRQSTLMTCLEEELRLYADVFLFAVS
jgi:dipeptidyl aminopeptidase/acylaminoacyl peptidase